MEIFWLKALNYIVQANALYFRAYLVWGIQNVGRCPTL